jgi:UDP-N-acetylmuramoylalanine--D-glutamate ligase
MTASPHIAAILNVTPNHLDRHRTMEAYTEAKARILDAQVVGDVAVLGLDDPIAASLAARAEHDVAYFSGRSPVDVGAWLVNDTLVCRPRFDLPMEKVCTIRDINLRGYHNVLNALAACAIAGTAGVPIPAMGEAIKKFQPVEHRLEVVREVDGATWVNDSIATAPERVIAALRAYSDRPVVLLLGGRDKKLPWGDLAALALQVCRAIITFGEAAPMIANSVVELRDAQGRQVSVEQVGTLAQAVQAARQVAQPGDVVLLSPGATSYDAYLDFAARGAHFKQLIGQL